MKKLLGTAALVAATAVVLAPPALAEDATAAASPPTLTVPGDNYYPESISAAANGDLYVGSITTGAITRFRAGVWQAEPFVAAGVNVGTAGVLVDDARKVLWACDIDLSFSKPTELRAFDLGSGSIVGSYALPDRGVCADLALANGDVYVTDTTDPTVSPQLPGRILKLRTPKPTGPANGTLAVWSADPLLTTASGGLQINGIAYDGAASFYTTNYSSGKLVRVDIAPDGGASPAVVIPLATAFTNPDGIRMLDRNRLLVTENPGRLSVVYVRTGVVELVTDKLDQPTSVARAGQDLWVTEGQVLRLQQGQPPNLPFTVRRVPVPVGV